MSYLSGGQGATLGTTAATTPSTYNINLSANGLIGSTSSLTFSGLFAVAANDPAGLAAANGASSIGLTATGASFTFDVARNNLSSLSLNTTGANAPLIIGAPVSSTNGFNLNTQGALDINAALTVTGLSASVLRTGADTTTVPGTSLTELYFGSGGSLDWTPASHGSLLSINNTPYTLVYSASDIQNMALSGNYALANALDATGVTGWVPVGLNASGQAQNGGLGFAGTFEGLGNTISNLLVTGNPNGNAAMFGYTSGAVRDLNLANITILGTGAVGALATSASGQLVNDTVVSGTVQGGNYAGGLVGQAKAGSVLVGDTSNATVHSTGTRVGGLAGWNAGTIVGAAVNATVIGTTQTGGLVGWNDGTITNSAVTVVSVAGSGQVGGIVGYNTATGILSGATATGSTAGTSGGGGNGGGGTGGSGTASATVGGSGTGIGGAIGDNKGQASSDHVVGLNVGGSSLTSVGGFVGQNEATGAITLSSTDANTGAGGSSGVGGFVGVNYGSVSTSSSAAGAGGLSYVGGFAGSNRANALLDQDTASGTTQGAGSSVRIGGLAGWNAGAITNSKASGHVSGFDDVGGLVGWNDGSVLNADASGEVTGSDYGAGGLVGYNTSAATLSSVYATGTVDGTAGGEGGLVGYNTGSVTNAYATGNVGIATTRTVGGLIGNNLGHVTDVYAAGNVNGAATRGALFGANSAAGTLTNGYYDTLVTGALAAIGSNANSAVHPVALAASLPPTDQASYSGFDFSAVWMIAAGQLPTLQHAP
jgi:hypothetical protein